MANRHPKLFNEHLSSVADFFGAFQHRRSAYHTLLAKASLSEATILDLLEDQPVGRQEVPWEVPSGAVEAAKAIADWEARNSRPGLPGGLLEEYSRSIVVLRGLLSNDQFSIPSRDFAIPVRLDSKEPHLAASRDCVVLGKVTHKSDRGTYLRVLRFRAVRGADFPIPTWDGLGLSLCAIRSDMVGKCIALVRHQMKLEKDSMLGAILNGLTCVHDPREEEHVEIAMDPESREWIDIGLETLRETQDEMSQEALSGSAATSSAPVVTLPEPRLVKGADAAEEYAAEVLRGIGFTNARRTPKGADGGADVLADGVVGQVKFEAVPVGRPPAQALFGVAAVEGALGVLFSLSGYSAQAVAWAERAGLALLEFEVDGSISAANEVGAELLSIGPAILTGRSEE